MITVRTNQHSLRTKRMIGQTQNRLDNSFARLSSGTSIVNPRDDLAHFQSGLRASTKVKSSHYAVRNIASGVSIVQGVESSARELQDQVQRIRELAVQSATAAIDEDSRFALQVEVAALIEEVNFQAKSADIGGIKLLDGSAQSLNFMVGTDVGNVVRLDLKSLTAKDLGQMVREPGLDIDPTVSLLSGDLEVNGISIRGTTLTDDLYSSHEQTGSAIAKANAINASAAFTNVEATALETFVLGESIVGGTLDENNQLVVNGQRILNIDVQAGDADGKLVGAINDLYETTGILAEVDEIGALTLIADDGRNISIETTSDAAATATGLNFGLADAIVTGGALQLKSRDTVELNLVGGSTDLAIGFGSGVGKEILGMTLDTNLETATITTQDEARRTIDVADSALETLREQVSAMGALNSRLEYAMQNLTAEQFSAQQSRSQMLDVDFAKEVVELTRQSISQEAQSAVMSQANSSPESALTLLDGMSSLGFSLRGSGPSFNSGAFSTSSYFSAGKFSSGFSLFG